jgi:hypothetical protein
VLKKGQNIFESHMTKERREGVFILACLAGIFTVFLLLCDWELGILNDTFCFNGVTVSCNVIDYDTKLPFYYTTYCLGGPGENHRIILAFCMHVKYMIIPFVPFFFYGLLRAFGIVNRFFRFEERLFKFIK